MTSYPKVIKWLNVCMHVKLDLLKVDICARSPNTGIMELTKHDLANIFQSSMHHFSGGYRDRGRRSPPYYDESEPEDPFRIFVALFDYDPLSMSPNPDAADEELPFKEGQIIKVRHQGRELQLIFGHPAIVIKLCFAVSSPSTLTGVWGQRH